MKVVGVVDGVVRLASDSGCSDPVRGLWRLENQARATRPQIECPHGHSGPWRYVEAIEVWRAVKECSPDHLIIDSHWQTESRYDDSLGGSGYLECRYGGYGDLCLGRVLIGDEFTIEWD